MYPSLLCHICLPRVAHRLYVKAITGHKGSTVLFTGQPERRVVLYVLLFSLSPNCFIHLQVLMEGDYKPSGWLGALMGTRLYFNMSDPRQIPSKMGALIKELGDAGRWVICMWKGGRDHGRAAARRVSARRRRSVQGWRADQRVGR